MKTDKTPTNKHHSVISNKICTEECPLPICNLPDLLSPKQMRMAMIELGLGFKQMTDDLHANQSALSIYVNYPERVPSRNRWVSDYLKAMLTEKKPHA